MLGHFKKNEYQPLRKNRIFDTNDEAPRISLCLYKRLVEMPLGS